VVHSKDVILCPVFSHDLVKILDMIFIGTSVSTARELDRLEPSVAPLFQSTMNLIVMSLGWINLDITYCSTGERKHSG
jgi:hypothetical protein